MERWLSKGMLWKLSTPLLLFWKDYDDGNILAIVPFSRNCVYYTIQAVITHNASSIIFVHMAWVDVCFVKYSSEKKSLFECDIMENLYIAFISKLRRIKYICDTGLLLSQSGWLHFQYKEVEWAIETLYIN